MATFTPIREVRKKRIDKKYEVGDDGVIYSDGLALAPINGVGVNLHGERKKIAYLVARAWVPNPECRPYVRHLNGDRTDNRPNNLEWCEKEEKRRRGRRPQFRWCGCWTKDGDQVGMYSCPADGAMDRGIDVRLVRSALNGKQRTAGGYLWRWL